MGIRVTSSSFRAPPDQKGQGIFTGSLLAMQDERLRDLQAWIYFSPGKSSAYYELLSSLTL